MRQITFEIPEEVAEQFESDVPPAERSNELTRLILHRRPRRQMTDAEWDVACDAVNTDSDITELEHDMDALSGDGLDEYPWESPASR